MRGRFSGPRFAVFEFNGGHEWAPAEVFGKAMTWLNEKPSGTSAPATGKGSSFDDFFKKK